LPPGKADVANIPYNLVDRVLAAAGEKEEKEDEAVQHKVKVLREALERRVKGLEEVQKTS
jgi:nuclear pore complex protein Nup160